jgi:hypothetical protein
MQIPQTFAASHDALHAAAHGATGLLDFGGEDEYRPGLTCLLDALDHDGPRFAAGGREFVFGSLVGALVARLTLQRSLRERPGSGDGAAQPIVRPLVITGVPRTGTTALHKLLSVDPQFQGLERWLTAFPMPRPPRDTWASNPMYQATVAGIEAFFAGAPEMRAAHDMVADDVDECLEVLKQNFCSNIYGSTFRVPGYDAWWAAQDESPSYRRYATALRVVGAGDARPWLLKNPGHLHTLDKLLGVFPDACIVQTHRDPVQALPSLCSVLAMARRLSEGANVMPEEIGAREAANWHIAVTRAMAFREQAPRGQFLDVRHADFHRDPMGVVRRIYAHFGYALVPEVERAMQSRIRANPEGRHGAHRYTGQQFGLQPDAIRERFAAYIQTYDLA